MPREISYAKAISEAIVQGMTGDPQVFLFGLGVDDPKGIFATTIEATKKFAPARVFDTPASENALTGVAIGAALNGKRPILVHARHDFMFLALDQMINNAAKWHYTYNGKSTAPIVVRAIVGKGWGQGPTHSQNLQALLAHFPGIIVAVPSNAYDVKGILLQSLKATAPVVIIEHRALYDDSMEVPENIYEINFGQARVARQGKDLTVVATTNMVKESLKAAFILAQHGIEIEVIDPVTIQPLDEGAILKSVAKTGHLLAVDSDWLRCSFASEACALVAEKGFASLKGPVKRIAWPESPCPVSKALEDKFYPNHHDIIRTVLAMLGKADLPVVMSEIKDTFVGPY